MAFAAKMEARGDIAPGTRCTNASTAIPNGAAPTPNQRIKPGNGTEAHRIPSVRIQA